MKQQNIGTFIATLRKEKGWTQKEMASRLGVSDKAVSKWETGKSLPDMGILIPVSELLDITVDELLSGDKRADQTTKGNGYEPSKIIIDYATRSIKRIKKSYRLIPVTILGSLLLCIIVLSGLGYSIGPNKEPENPLKDIVERNPINSIGMADMTDEEQALSNFANGTKTGKNYLTYRFSDDKKMSSLGLYMFDGTKWVSYPIITNSESHLGLISIGVNDGIAEVGLYEADDFASYTATRPVAGYQESWNWGSGIPEHSMPVSDPGTRVIAFWMAGDEGISVPSDVFYETTTEWLEKRSSLELNACVVALYIVVE